MKIYSCSNCHNSLYFENDICLRCQHTVGFDAQTLSLLTLVSKEPGHFFDFADNSREFKFCSNAQYGSCNWVIPINNNSEFCLACNLNHVIPSLDIQQNITRWKKIEVAKHRLVYSLLKLKLPMSVNNNGEIEALEFQFMADTDPVERVLTGHDKGVITLNIEEADEAARAVNKMNLGEKYRTLLGHFRHEVGHFYWDVFLPNNKNLLKKFRTIFGDDQADYGQALEKYYQTGPPLNWNEEHISPYATAHPWEDWAETWAHYLHMMDTLETATYFGVTINPDIDETANVKARFTKDPYEIKDFNKIISLWLPLTFSLNSLNRSMGHGEFYPFIISPAIISKLKFIHEICYKSSHASQIAVETPFTSVS